MKPIRLSTLLHNAKTFACKHFLLCLWLLSSLSMVSMLIYIWWNYANDFVRDEIKSYALIVMIPTVVSVTRSVRQWLHRKNKRVLICMSDGKMSVLAGAIGTHLTQSCYSPYIGNIDPDSEYRKAKLIQDMEGDSYVVLLVSSDFLDTPKHRDWMQQIIEAAASHKIDIVSVVEQKNNPTVRQADYMENLISNNLAGIDSADIDPTETCRMFRAAERVCDKIDKLDDEQCGYYRIASFIRRHFFRYLDPEAWDE